MKLSKTQSLSEFYLIFWYVYSCRTSLLLRGFLYSLAAQYQAIRTNSIQAKIYHSLFVDETVRRYKRRHSKVVSTGIVH